MFSNLRQHKLRLAVGLSSILLVASWFVLRPYAFNETIENTLVELQFKLRGPRHLSEQFMVVFIGAEDVRTLGGWPLTRDYYGYLVHILSERGAKVIGLDLLLDAPQWRYPENDSALVRFLANFANDCLPLTFAELQDGTPSLQGVQPTRPWPPFRQQIGGEGFSNFERTRTLHYAPVIAAEHDTLVPSFGLELARLFLQGQRQYTWQAPRLTFPLSNAQTYDLPLDAHGRVRLNHFGEVEMVPALSLIELMQTYATNPEALHFEGKLVLVAVTAPSLCTFKSTPLAASLPASLLQLTVAENIVNQNYMRTVGTFAQLLLVVGMVLAVGLLSKITRTKFFLMFGLGFLLAYGLVAALLFRFNNLILPLAQPALAMLCSLAFVFLDRVRERHENLTAQQDILHTAILAKEAQLETAAAAHAELQQQWHKELREQTEFSQERLRELEARQQQILQLEKQLKDLHAYAAPALAAPQNNFSDIVHAPESPMRQVLDLVAKVSRDELPVLIQGETGTGKELIARAIHHMSRRQAAPFIAVNCGALPETLLESELFGHEKGSFTGAHMRRRGRFELAAGGTIFLDEIGETTPTFQARLLRVLQEGTFERLGGEASLQAEVRVLAASNRELHKEVAEKNFRADLFYRLNGFVINLPPLRERKSDVPLLAQHFLQKHHAGNLPAFSEEAMAAMQSYAWPGNVRELENAVRRAALLAHSANRQLIRHEDLPPEIIAPHTSLAAPQMYQALPEQILQSLRGLKFSRSAISQTAKALGNRDRGTITEYFRGMCFESFVQANYDSAQAARALAGTNEEETIQRVRVKLEEYLANLRAASDLSVQCKGLPKRYHEYVEKIAQRFKTL